MKSLIACAVQIVRRDPTCHEVGELAERIKQLASRRGLTYRSAEITYAIERAQRYQG